MGLRGHRTAATRGTINIRAVLWLFAFVPCIPKLARVRGATTLGISPRDPYSALYNGIAAYAQFLDATTTRQCGRLGKPSDSAAILSAPIAHSSPLRRARAKHVDYLQGR